MIRRKFINILSAYLGTRFLRPILFAKDVGNYTGARLKVLKGGLKKEIVIMTKWEQYYISLDDFAQALNYGIFTNAAKRKAVLYVDRDKATFTADNSFVILNNHVYQFTYEPLWYESGIWVPINILADVFNKYSAQKFFYNPTNKTLTINKKNVNISKIDISSKKNGYLIHIYAEEKFPRKNVSLKEKKGWLYVEIVGGKVDVKALNRKIPKGLISEIKAIQFSQTVSIAFKLRKTEVERELIFDEESNDIYVNLRISEEIPKEDIRNSELDAQRKEWLIDTIVIDPGHGGKDPGAVGYKKLYEKSIVLPVALKLGKMITKKMPDVRVVYTRKTDVFIPLWKRTKIANENKGKLFISLHCNSSTSKKANGFETFFLSADKDERAKSVVLKENESITFEGQADRKRYQGINFILATMAQNAFIKQSQFLASVVQSALAKKLVANGMKNRGVKQGPFWVMVGATMPNILIEMGYVSNKAEAKFLKQKGNQTKIAQAIYNGIAQYKEQVESTI